MSAPDTVGVVGAGAWGTAIAQLAASNGYQVRLWARDPARVEAIVATRRNEAYLPGVDLAPLIEPVTDLTWVAEAEVVFVVTPAQAMRAVLEELPCYAQPLVLCSKGIEAGTLKLMHEVAREALEYSPVAVLSGPTFAGEVARGLPTAVTIAAEDAGLASQLASYIARPTFRTYTSTDVVGAEIGGAVKNVLAIACGVVEGAGLGNNARAALIARGFAEMTRFGLARGARAETLAGLSGLGDLVLTCSSAQSRNFSLGVGLGRGERPADLLAGRSTVAEGAATAPVLREAAAAAGVEMPVTEAVCQLLRGCEATAVVRSLLARPLRSEA